MSKKIQYCSVDDIIYYRMLFNNNPKIKWIFRDGIDKVILEMFKDYYVSNPKDNQSKGIYGFESEGRSVINKLNTNYTAFCILVNDINKVIQNTTPYPIIDFKNKTNKEQESEVHRFLTYINLYKERIFNPNSKTFNKILSSLTSTDEEGTKTEITAAKILQKHLGPKYKVEVIGALGNIQDMVHGIDIEITKDNITKTAQVKPFMSFKQKDDDITMLGTSNVKQYSTDFLIFRKNNEVLMFNNSPKIIEGNYVFNKKDLVYHIR